MNSDLYNFHFRFPPVPSTQQVLLPSSCFTLTSSFNLILVCRPCTVLPGMRGTFGRCRFRHVCSSCDGDHSRATCPFFPPASRGGRCWLTGGVQQYHCKYCTWQDCINWPATWNTSVGQDRVEFQFQVLHPRLPSHLVASSCWFQLTRSVQRWVYTNFK